MKEISQHTRVGCDEWSPLYYNRVEETRLSFKGALVRMQLSGEMPSHHPTLLWMTVKQKEDFALCISSPSSCLSVLEGAGPLSVLQFSERGAYEETGSRTLTTSSTNVTLYLWNSISLVLFSVKLNHHSIDFRCQMSAFNMQIPSGDPHIAAQTQRAQSLVWSVADGLAVQQNRIQFN